MRFPNFDEEIKLTRRGYDWIAGIDEVGRGPLAGPVVAAAVMIKGLRTMMSEPGAKDFFLAELAGVRDSKKVPPVRREKLYEALTSHPAVAWGIGIVSEKVIDEINILEATLLAMKTAAGNLKTKCDFVLLDGNHLLADYPVSQIAIVKGDEKVFSIAAASIIAKVTRDRLMLECHLKFPEYSFDRHKGYGTKLHMEKLRKYGPSAIHRLSFAPVKKVSGCGARPPNFSG